VPCQISDAKYNLNIFFLHTDVWFPPRISPLNNVLVHNTKDHPVQDYTPSRPHFPPPHRAACQKTQLAFFFLRFFKRNFDFFWPRKFNQIGLIFCYFCIFFEFSAKVVFFWGMSFPSCSAWVGISLQTAFTHFFSLRIPNSVYPSPSPSWAPNGWNAPSVRFLGPRSNEGPLSSSPLSPEQRRWPICWMRGQALLFPGGFYIGVNNETMVPSLLVQGTSLSKGPPCLRDLPRSHRIFFCSGRPLDKGGGK
jgi:hypothetical protein